MSLMTEFICLGENNRKRGGTFSTFIHFVLGFHFWTKSSLRKPIKRAMKRHWQLYCQLPDNRFEGPKGRQCRKLPRKKTLALNSFLRRDQRYVHVWHNLGRLKTNSSSPVYTCAWICRSCNAVRDLAASYEVTNYSHSVDEKVCTLNRISSSSHPMLELGGTMLNRLAIHLLYMSPITFS